MRKEKKLRVGKEGEPIYFITVFPSGEIEIRPKSARNPDATVVITVDGAYQSALVRRAKAEKRPRRKPISRGLLSLEKRGS